MAELTEAVAAEKARVLEGEEREATLRGQLDLLKGRLDGVRAELTASQEETEA